MAYGYMVSAVLSKFDQTTLRSVFLFHQCAVCLYQMFVSDVCSCLTLSTNNHLWVCAPCYYFFISDSLMDWIVFTNCDELVCYTLRVYFINDLAILFALRMFPLTEKSHVKLTNQWYVMFFISSKYGMFVSDVCIRCLLVHLELKQQ